MRSVEATRVSFRRAGRKIAIDVNTPECGFGFTVDSRPIYSVSEGMFEVALEAVFAIGENTSVTSSGEFRVYHAGQAIRLGNPARLYSQARKALLTP